MIYPNGYPFNLHYYDEKDFEDVKGKTQEEVIDHIVKLLEEALEGSPEDQARQKAAFEKQKRRWVREELKKKWVREEVRKMEARKRSHILARRKKRQNPSPTPLRGPSGMLKSAGTGKWMPFGQRGRLCLCDHENE